MERNSVRYKVVSIKELLSQLDSNHSLFSFILLSFANQILSGAETLLNQIVVLWQKGDQKYRLE